MATLQLQERDYALFKIMIDHKFATMDLILNNVWTDISNNYGRQRMWKLMGGKGDKFFKWIQKSKHPFISDNVYTLTKGFYEVLKGNKTFQNKLKKAERTDKNGDKITLFKPKIKQYIKRRNQEFSLARFEHDYILMKSRLILENQGFLQRCIADTYIHSKKMGDRFNQEKGENIGVVPDFVGKMNGEKVAFEMERSAKDKSAYTRKLGRYYSKSAFDKIIYIYEDNYVRNEVRKASEHRDLRGYDMSNLYFLSTANLFNKNFVLEGKYKEDDIEFG